MNKVKEYEELFSKSYKGYQYFIQLELEKKISVVYSCFGLSSNHYYNVVVLN